VSLSPALAEHLSSCPACQAEQRAVRDLLEVSAAIVDPAPPADVWEGFPEALDREIARARPGTARLDRWSRAALGLAATLVLGFALGAVWMRAIDPASPTAGLPPGSAATVFQEPRDPRMDLYLDEIESVLVAYRASEQGDAVDVFRRSVPATMLAGEGAPSEAARQRLEQQRAAREQLRTLVLAMLASEIESERTGFGYIERRIAEIAGQELLILVH
jgi:hypothetical protein